jgi:alkylmercury lyase
MAIDALSQRDLNALADDIDAAMPKLDRTEQRVAVQLYRLLADGQPVEHERLALRAGVPLSRVTRLLSSWPGVYQDDQGRVIGFWGLSLATMRPHSFEVAGQRLWTWCAWDALFIPGILGTSAHVDSTCATTGEPVSMVVGPQGVTELSPAGSVLSFLRPKARFDYKVILNFCQYVLFLSSEAAGRQWMSQRPNAFLLTITDGFELGRLLVQRHYGPMPDAEARAI